MERFTVKRLDETNFSIEQVFELMQESFKERLEQGLKFTCSTMSLDSFIRKTGDGVVLVAEDCHGELAGAITFHLYIDSDIKTYSYMEYVAVRPDIKRRGVASSIFFRVRYNFN